MPGMNIPGMGGFNGMIRKENNFNIKVA